VPPHWPGHSGAVWPTRAAIMVGLLSPPTRRDLRPCGVGRGAAVVAVGQPVGGGPDGPADARWIPADQHHAAGEPTATATLARARVGGSTVGGCERVNTSRSPLAMMPMNSPAASSRTGPVSDRGRRSSHQTATPASSQPSSEELDPSSRPATGAVEAASPPASGSRRRRPQRHQRGDGRAAACRQDRQQCQRRDPAHRPRVRSRHPGDVPADQHGDGTSAQRHQPPRDRRSMCDRCRCIAPVLRQRSTIRRFASE
jgi:hypothetical protein